MVSIWQTSNSNDSELCVALIAGSVGGSYE
jgi:hypothetical protein